MVPWFDGLLLVVPCFASRCVLLVLAEPSHEHMGGKGRRGWKGGCWGGGIKTVTQKDKKKQIYRNICFQVSNEKNPPLF